MPTLFRTQCHPCHHQTCADRRPLPQNVDKEYPHNSNPAVAAGCRWSGRRGHSSVAAVAPAWPPAVRRALALDLLPKRLASPSRSCPANPLAHGGPGTPRSRPHCAADTMSHPHCVPKRLRSRRLYPVDTSRRLHFRRQWTRWRRSLCCPQWQSLSLARRAGWHCVAPWLCENSLKLYPTFYAKL